MNRVTPLARTPLVALARFDHPPDDVHRDPDEERSRCLSVSFVESGGFALRTDRGRERLSARALFVSWPGLAYTCEHPSEGAPDDVCLTLDFEEPFGADILAAHAAEEPAAPTAPLTNRLGYLRDALAGAADDAVALETLASAVLQEVLRRPRAGPLFRPSQLQWYARRIDAARELMETSSAEPHSLADLARDAAMSPFHFARVFAELVGTPPHRYLRDLRLRAAATRLREGASVTGACFASGFANLGHFTRSFRRAYGVLPSRFAG